MVSHNFVECISLAASLIIIRLGKSNYSVNGDDDVQYLYCKMSHSFRYYFEHIKNKDEIVYLISLSSQNFPSSKKKYFIVGGNLKLQKQGNKSGSRS